MLVTRILHDVIKKPDKRYNKYKFTLKSFAKLKAKLS